jgi:hypothetical protein
VVEQEEHDAIARNRKDPDAPVTWAEYRSMTFTNQVSLAPDRCAPSLLTLVLSYEHLHKLHPELANTV